MHSLLPGLLLASAVVVAVMTTYYACLIALAYNGLPQLIQWGIEKWMM